MAKAYVCDACGKTMTNPYEAKMREFYVGVEVFEGTVFPCNVKTIKTKVHLCDECYHGLKDVADRNLECESIANLTMAGDVNG